MKKTLYFSMLLLLLTALFTGCTSQPQSNPAPIKMDVTLTPSKSAIAGKLLSEGSASNVVLPNTPVHLARVYWDEGKKNGAFALDGANGPSTISKEDGTFVIANIEPGEYVIVVGEVIGSSVIIPDSKGDALVVKATGDQVTNVGELKVNLGN